jgi:hypothetical protein
MKVLIRVVTSTAGNDHEFLGRHVGMALLDRALCRQVVVFETEMTDHDFDLLNDLTPGQLVHDRLCRQLAFEHALSIESIHVIKVQ